jgi:nitrogen fixation/metabolism regulation signal transduction histidine kinase
MWVVGGAVMSILLFLLASASSNTDFFDQNYSWLLLLNGLVAAALLVLVIVMLARLYRRYKRGKFGSRLMTRLVLLFALMGILPGTVIYAVSVQFVSRSIETWFDVRVESALESGLNLGRAVLDSSLSELNKRAHALASELADLSPSEQTLRLSRLRDESQSLEATIVTANGQVIATSSSELSKLVPELPTSAMMQQARLASRFSALEGEVDLPDTPEKEADGLRLRVVVPIPGAGHSLSQVDDSLFLQLLQPVPTGLAANAEALRVAYSEYQTRSLARTGLRKIYIVTLSLTLLLAVVGAIASAFQIATNLAKPLLLLAEGTKAVAEGDLSPRPIVSTSDELGTLTQSFNAMTRQLFDARSTAEGARAELENAKIYLESVLANMSAGVIVLDRDFRLVSCNEPVESILRQDLKPHLGQELSAIEGLTPFASAIVKAFSEQNARSAVSGNKPAGRHWQQQIEIPHAADSSEGDHDIALLARGSRLPVREGIGYIVVFDDISDVISAQRSIAWGEVARRLAHEIKNPLTPIQLSAERLQMKLHDKLEPPEASMLSKSTATIVNQVASMKRMVDNFREYATTPPAILEPLDLNALVEEIIHLYTGSDKRSIIHTALAPSLPKIMGDATQLRQVIHNLLQNAQDAVNENTEASHVPSIDVATEEVHYQDAGDQVRVAVRLSVRDNGPGFASKILGRVFEPYVTTKSRGTGLGMAMVKKIIDEHGGRVDLQNRSDISGAKVSILLLKLAPSEQ